MPPSQFLKRRNALWQRLRELLAEDDFADSPEFEAALLELSELIGWERTRVLAGLGLDGLFPEDRP
ncbi:hypothetical protein [Deinococcus marmoris]|uniref:Uncharacterized protein n=1 Tax=Deinococcus marmoris TaxID=249408 RepID=A0A1U7P1V4_9DEIO|nr:hypothetical protein [Deinococcus marmoris]OLV19140.1 hypothetical protein BOO71_0003673 [Deinococcus marmoris]